MATIALLVKAAKLTLGHSLEVQTPHQVQSVLDIKGHQWLTGGWLTKYQALLLESPEIILKVCQTLNPAPLLPIPEEKDDLIHSCVETIE